jgi:EAL domain-containing protein (putative c-di-GMP-specific phosphodiesterase class I)
MMNFIKPQSEGAEYSPLASLLTSPLLSPLTSPTIAQPERIVTQSKDFELAMLQGIIMELDQAQLRKAVEKFYSRFCGNNLPAAAPLDLKSPVASPRMTQRV